MTHTRTSKTPHRSARTKAKIQSTGARKPVRRTKLASAGISLPRGIRPASAMALASGRTGSARKARRARPARASRIAKTVRKPIAAATPVAKRFAARVKRAISRSTSAR